MRFGFSGRRVDEATFCSDPVMSTTTATNSDDVDWSETVRSCVHEDTEESSF